MICLAIALGASSGTPQRMPTAPTEIAAVQVAAKLRALLADPSPKAVVALRERVQQGAPPAALVALLDAYRKQPRAELLDVVQELAQYRRSDVRAHALFAWAQTSAHEADLAIAAAATDVDPGIRRIAIVLAKQHPSPAASARIAELLDHDRPLADEVAAMAALEAAEDAEIEIEGDS
ncbi:MAG TPA: hypothetical protein VG755_06095 [Nannocystaceae bacterium]|nr:hypothetical protein [Nannocystaceae bacterium]